MATYSSTPIASTYYQVKAGGDAAALKGIAKALLQLDDEHGNALDHAFIAEHTEGFADFAADLKTTGWDAIEAESGWRAGIWNRSPPLTRNPTPPS